MTTQLTLRRPDDWHLHLRDEKALETTVPHSAAYFGRAIVMPNLRPPLTTLEAVKAYQARILAAVPEGMHFTPLMTLYMTEDLPVETIKQGYEQRLVQAVKLYPANATTNSDAGVKSLDAISAQLEAMQALDMPLLVHGEVTASDIDVFDREARFLEEKFAPLVARFPKLRIVLEHITTKEAVEFIKDGPDTLAATITAHHLVFNRNDLVNTRINPHLFCLPILKRSTHQQALIAAATSGSSSFFLGTDSAPHVVGSKLCSSGCAGVYTAPVALSMYAQVFDSVNKLDNLEAFTSLNGPAFYGLEANSGTVTLAKSPWTVPETYDFCDSTLVPACAGMTLNWSVQ